MPCKYTAGGRSSYKNGQIMRIGILGAGNLGRTLAWLWTELGHEVHLASGDAAKAERLATAMGATGWGSYHEIVDRCPLLLYTVRGVPPVTLTGESAAWRGQTVIDCRLEEIPLNFDFPSRPRSLAEELAEQIPMCNVVKAFCLHPLELYQHGPERLREWSVQSYYCGDLPEAKSQVSELIRDSGMLGFDCGGLKRARLLEAQGNFWRIFQLHQGQALVSQFQLVGYPEPLSYPYGARTPSYASPDAGDPTLLPIEALEGEAPLQ